MRDSVFHFRPGFVPTTREPRTDLAFFRARTIASRTRLSIGWPVIEML